MRKKPTRHIAYFQEYSKGKIKKYFFPVDYLTAEMAKETQGTSKTIYNLIIYS